MKNLKVLSEVLGEIYTILLEDINPEDKEIIGKVKSMILLDPELAARLVAKVMFVPEPQQKQAIQELKRELLRRISRYHITGR